MSVDDLVKADMEGRKLTAQEQSYLMGLAYGVIGLGHELRLRGWPEHAMVCMTGPQMRSMNPDWLHRILVKTILEEGTRFNPSIIMAHALSESFPCSDTPPARPVPNTY